MLRPVWTQVDRHSSRLPNRLTAIGGRMAPPQRRRSRRWTHGACDLPGFGRRYTAPVVRQTGQEGEIDEQHRDRAIRVAMRYGRYGRPSRLSRRNDRPGHCQDRVWPADMGHREYLREPIPDRARVSDLPRWGSVRSGSYGRRRRVRTMSRTRGSGAPGCGGLVITLHRSLAGAVVDRSRYRQLGRAS
jgi:hypothetical protein